jgi:hypothetical protein
MADEIIVNDGGAPSRIIPFTCGSVALDAGDALSLHSDGTVVTAKTSKGAAGGEAFIGVALTDAAVGGIVNVVTGHGIVVRCLVGNVAQGAALEISNVDGELGDYTGTYPASGNPVAVALEDNGSGSVLTKVLIL